MKNGVELGLQCCDSCRKWSHRIQYRRDPVVKFLRSDKAIRIKTVGTDVLENRVHPRVVFKLILTKGMNSTIQLFATLANKLPKAGHGSIHSGTRNIGARPCVVQRRLDTGVSWLGRGPCIDRWSGDARRGGVIPHPVIGERVIEIEPGGVLNDNRHRCRVGGG